MHFAALRGYYLKECAVLIYKLLCVREIICSFNFAQWDGNLEVKLLIGALGQ